MFCSPPPQPWLIDVLESEERAFIGGTSVVNSFFRHEWNLNFCDFLCKSHKMIAFSDLHSCGVVRARNTSTEIYYYSGIFQRSLLQNCHIRDRYLLISLFLKWHTICLGLQRQKKCAKYRRTICFWNDCLTYFRMPGKFKTFISLRFIILIISGLECLSEHKVRVGK